MGGHGLDASDPGTCGGLLDVKSAGLGDLDVDGREMWRGMRIYAVGSRCRWFMTTFQLRAVVQTVTRLCGSEKVNFFVSWVTARFSWSVLSVLRVIVYASDVGKQTLCLMLYNRKALVTASWVHCGVPPDIWQHGSMWILSSSCGMFHSRFYQTDTLRGLNICNPVPLL